MPGRDGRRAGAPRYPCDNPPSPGKHRRWQRVPWLGAGLVSVSALSGNSSASIRLLLQALGGTALARNASQHHPRSFLRVYRGRPATAGGLRTSRVEAAAPQRRAQRTHSKCSRVQWRPTLSPASLGSISSSVEHLVHRGFIRTKSECSRGMNARKFCKAGWRSAASWNVDRLALLLLTRHQVRNAGC